MIRRRIAVTIRPDGTIEAETLGIVGKDCLDYLPLLEDLLDAEAVQSSFTADYTVTGTAPHVEVGERATGDVREHGTT